MPVWKLAIIIFIMLSVVFAGAGVIAVLTMPGLADQAMRLIPLVAGGGFVLSAIVSLFVAKQIVGPARG